MEAPEGQAAPESGDKHIPTFEELAADPEIAALIGFDPIPRANTREDGWTAPLQRMFIAHLANTGSPGKACDALGKRRSGIDKLSKKPEAKSFRDACAKAIELAEKRRAAKIAADHAGMGDVRMPFIDHRRKHLPLEQGPLPGQQPSDEQKWELMQTIGIKFMRKVAAEREARLAGEIVAADFYLRQITVMEVMIDLLSCEWGWDPQEVLGNLRRGEHEVHDIASTWLSEWMDRSRRLWWREEEEPERPAWPDTHFLERRTHRDGDYAVQTDIYACNGMRPPPGIDQAEWDAMGKADQNAAIEQMRAEMAAEQRAWEARAHAEWVAAQVTEEESSETD